jgi:hypothetical protein
MKSEEILGFIALGLIAYVALGERKSDFKKDPNREYIPNKGDWDKPSYVFPLIEDQFGKSIAKNTERIYRLETRNFTSGQYMAGRSAGMEATQDAFPYGWSSLKNMWMANPNLKPIGLDLWESDSGGRPDVNFIVFPNLYAGAVALAQTLKNRGNKPGSWFSKDPQQQASYERVLSNYQAKYV